MPEKNRRELRGLYAITPDGLDENILLARVEAALRGGVQLVQYRDKQSDLAQKSTIARALKILCQNFGATLIINDDVSLALAVDADGVHLGADDGDLLAARLTLGASKLLGASCYANFDLARAAQAAGADYVAFGATYPSPTKPQAVQAPLTLLGRCRDELCLPSCAIGGITMDNAPAVIAAGASMIAVISDLFTAPKIELRARALQRLFQGEPA